MIKVYVLNNIWGNTDESMNYKLVFINMFIVIESLINISSVIGIITFSITIKLRWIMKIALNWSTLLSTWRWRDITCEHFNFMQAWNYYGSSLDSCLGILLLWSFVKMCRLTIWVWRTIWSTEVNSNWYSNYIFTSDKEIPISYLIIIPSL